MLRRSLIGLCLLFAGTVAACSEESHDSVAVDTNEIRELSETEVLADLDALGTELRTNYGLLEFKKARFGFDLDAELALARTKVLAGKTEGDRIRPFYELLAKLKDGHVNLSYAMRPTSATQRSIPLYISPVGDDYVVSHKMDEFLVGDRVISIDGKTTHELEQLLMPIVEIGTLESSRHRAAQHMAVRPFYVGPELQPKAEKAAVVIERDGVEMTIELPWTVQVGGSSGLIRPPVNLPPPATPIGTDATALAINSILANGPDGSTWERGAVTPWFFKPETAAALGVTKVTPRPETLEKYSFPGQRLRPIPVQLSAWRYRFEEKNILLLRLPTFDPQGANYDAHVAWVSAILDDANAAASTDVVVLDVSHNPGGKFAYVEGLISMFLTKPIKNELIAERANRARVLQYVGNVNSAVADPVARPVWLDRLAGMESANDRGDLLAPFTPGWGSFMGPTVPRHGLYAVGETMIAPHPRVTWKGPILVLQDELSGSCGDVFPAIMQSEGVAKTFGARTAGMGGPRGDYNLPVSGAYLALTTGLFGPADGNGGIKNIENDGVTPDFPRALTRADMKNGYIDYVRDFSRVAIGLTR